MKKSILTIYLCICTLLSNAQQFRIENDMVSRHFSIEEKTFCSKSLKLNYSDTNFISEENPEFSILVNGAIYTGQSKWNCISVRDTTDLFVGLGKVISMQSANKDFIVELIYMLYPSSPVIRKALRVVNTGMTELKLEAIDVEKLNMEIMPAAMWVINNYARNKRHEQYVGDWHDPLISIHDFNNNKGLIIGNEALGVTKRIGVLEEGRYMTAGLTHPEQAYPFRKWLSPSETYTTPWVFIAPYLHYDYAFPLNTIVPDFVRKHMGVRIEEIKEKPMFVYNTWYPFLWNIDENLVRELALAASECGVEEFIIDDGWQINIDLHSEGRKLYGDWEVNKEKFPNGLKPVFDYIKSLGMRPGLWLSLASVDPSSQVYRQHPEWFVKNKKNEHISLHSVDNHGYTACMGTDWYGYIKETLLRLVREHGLEYVKLDLAIVTSAYVYDVDHTGCNATDHLSHKDREESFAVIYERCMQLFDELHTEAPDLFIDCTFETAGKMHLTDFGIARHAEGNWLSNIEHNNPNGSLRVRHLAWSRTPVIPAASLVIGNLCMDNDHHELDFFSLAGTLPIMLGDPRQLSEDQRKWYKSWSSWLKKAESKHGFMSFRQDLPGFGEPAEGSWDAFSRINTETGSGGIIGIFRHGSHESNRQITIPWLKPDSKYIIRQGPENKMITVMLGRELEKTGFNVKFENLYEGTLFECIEYE